MAHSIGAHRIVYRSCASEWSVLTFSLVRIDGQRGVKFDSVSQVAESVGVEHATARLQNTAASIVEDVYAHHKSTPRTITASYMAAPSRKVADNSRTSDSTALMRDPVASDNESLALSAQAESRADDEMNDEDSDGDDPQERLWSVIARKRELYKTSDDT